MGKIVGVMVIIEQAGKYLLGKRSREKDIAPNYWAPISGKLEAGETQEMAVSREVLEEVGLIVNPIRKIETMYSRDEKCILHWWYAKIISGSAWLSNDEHTELAWVSVEEMTRLNPIFPEDIEVFRKFELGF